MTNNSPSQKNEAIIKEHQGISAVWLVPVIALLFGAWLVIKAYNERGTYITVQFPNANGIVVGKTEVKYKGLTAGVVKNIDAAPDLQSVIVDIEMISSVDDMLTDQTLFWLVTADVSLQGVTGLDTLLSGSYINVHPDLDADGESRREFIALNEEPQLDEALPGLHIKLQTKTLGSLAKNSPVSFKQISVGYVSGFEYDENTERVNLSLFIEPEYAHLVKENSRFWNASGVNITGSLSSGIKVKTESFASIIAGGIAFDTVDYEAKMPPANNGQLFTLHQDFQTAEMGHEIEIALKWNSGIDVGAQILYHGIKVGRVDEFLNLDPENQRSIAKAKVDPRVVPYLTTKTQFYVAAPEFDLGGVTNLQSLLVGSHIGVRPSTQGEPINRFNVYNRKPAYEYSKPGLHLTLKTSHLGSLNTTSDVFYKQQEVGSVQKIENVGASEFLVHIFIQPEFQHFVAEDSRFWNASGLRLTGSLQGFELQAQSLQSILTGGIAFDKGDSKNSPTNGDDFTLFSSVDVAKEEIKFNLITTSSRGLTTSTRIMYRGEKVGSIHNITHINGETILDVGILPSHEYTLREKSQFWVVKPNISLSGLADTDAIFGGSYITVNVGEGEVKNHFLLSDKAPAKHFSSDGLQLALTSKRGNVVNPNSPVSYRGLTVGQVDNISLAEDGEEVKINITIDEEYRYLISNHTRFYNASGFTVSGGLGNLSIKTESSDAIMKGGISFFNPEGADQNSNLLSEGDKFVLLDNINHAEMAGVAVQIHFKDIYGLSPNLKIKYQGQQVGLVSRVVFNKDDFGATVFALLNDRGKIFASEGTQFWFAKPELGLVGSRHVESIFNGGFIAIKPGKGEHKNNFIASDTPPVIDQLPYGLNLTLTSKELGSIRPGNPVLYRQVKVGQVIGVDLAENADEVEIFINIFERYAPLVSTNSQFWNTSGVKIDAGLFSGVSIDSESIETLLSGGIAFATPENTSDNKASQGHTFSLAERVNSDWKSWSPSIAITK